MKLKIVLGTLIALFIFISVSNSSIYLDEGNTDAERHFKKIIGECDSIDWDACKSYPNFYHSVAGIFVQDKPTFFYFNLLLMVIVLPAILFYYSRNIYVPIFYFIGTNITLAAFRSGAYPSFFILIPWIIFLKTDRNSLKLLLLFLSLFIHNSAVYLFIVTWLVQGLFANGNGFAITALGTFTGGLSRLKGNINAYLDYWALSMFPLFSVLGFMNLVKERKFDLILIITASVIWSVVNIRAIYPAVIILLFSFGDFFKGQSLYVKVLLVFGSLVYLGLNFLNLTNGFGGFVDL